MQVTNQKPAVLSPVYKSAIKGDFEPQVYLKKTLAEPLFTPVIAGQTVSITENKQSLNADNITDYIINCLGENTNTNSEQFVKTLFDKTLVYFDKTTNLSVQDLFAIQSAIRENTTSNSKSPPLPFPDQSTIYTPATDVIPSCRRFLAGLCSYDVFFASLAFYARPDTLGFYFANSVAFDDFKSWLDTQVQAINSILPSGTNKLFSDFQKLDLSELTESLILRNDDSDNNEEYSFARMIISYLMAYTTQKSQNEFGILPFSLGELFCPRTIVFVNIEAHSKASSKQIADEWSVINKSLNAKIKMISNNKLQKLTSATRYMQNLQNSANATAASNRMQKTQKQTIVKFKKSQPTAVDIFKIVTKISKKMAFVAKSENIFKVVKHTFAKPNRRDPDNFNKQGKITSIKYNPDLHIYMDSSGSISEEQYRDIIKALIVLAKKLNINLYFNSFSHVLSQCTKLHTKDKSLKQIYTQFRKVPKVTGGTDYEQIWNYINGNPKRRKELSIIITDFEYTPPNRYIKHPANLYYVPCSHMNWNRIVADATYFCKAMLKNDPDIRKKLLF